MLPPFLGALLLLATGGVVLVAVAAAIWAGVKGHRALRLLALLSGGAMAGLYGLFWMAGLLLAPRTVLPPGQALSFCGLDCHLHVSIDAVEPGADLGVVVRFRSNAVRAPEWPGALHFRLVDGSGREFSPSNAVPDSALLAGQSWTYALHFPAEAQAQGAALLVTWKPGIDYLVPGAGNPLVQRRKRLALPVASGSGV